MTNIATIHTQSFFRKDQDYSSTGQYVTAETLTLNRFRTAILWIRAENQGKFDVEDTKTALGGRYCGFELKIKANLTSKTRKQPWEADSVDSTLRKPENPGRVHAKPPQTAILWIRAENQGKFDVEDTKTALGCRFCGFDPLGSWKIKVDSTLNRFRTAILWIRAENQGKFDVEDTKTALGCRFCGFDPREAGKSRSTLVFVCQESLGKDDKCF